MSKHNNANDLLVGYACWQGARWYHQKRSKKEHQSTNFRAVCLDDGCVDREHGNQAMRQCQVGSELQKLRCSPLKNCGCATTNCIPFGKRYFQVQAVKFRASFGSQICSLVPPESAKMGRSCPVLLPCCISRTSLVHADLHCHTLLLQAKSSKMKHWKLV